MTKRDLAAETIKKCGGIARTKSLNEAGLENYEIARFCDYGYLKRVRHGYYSLSDMTDDVILSAVLPEGIVCMESALFHYGYADNPGVWKLTLPRNISRSKLDMDCIVFKAYFAIDKYYDMGRVEDDFEGAKLAVYDRERTICDLFKHRKYMEPELFSSAVYAYAKDDKKNLDNLYDYAEKMHIRGKVNDVMEVVLNAQ